MSRYIFLFSLLFIAFNSMAQPVASIEDPFEPHLIGKELLYVEDKTNSQQLSDIIARKDFQLVGKDVANFQVSPSTFWLRFTIRNNSSANNYQLVVKQPLLDYADFYYPADGGYKEIQAGERFPYKQRLHDHAINFTYDLDIPTGEEKTYYLKVKSSEQILVPIEITSTQSVVSDLVNRNVGFGIYCGIILVMFLYNLFVFYSTRDRSYVYYVLHTLFVGLTQASIQGFTYKFLWPDSPWFANYSVFIFTCLVSIVGVQFLIEFMQLKQRARKAYITLKIFQAIYLVYAVVSAAGVYEPVYGAILSTQSIIALYILGLSIYLIRKGYGEAKFYLIAWSSLMLGIIIYVTKDFGLLPYNNFTANSLLFGSAAEVTLLSFALADKINIYKADKEKSQETTLNALQENERLLNEQNVMLETKVNERTLELQASNEELNKTLQELKDAEMQLVESEKMASLGQLTAGIAHEINNPINFVTSNVKPLKRDVEMMIDMLNQVEEIGLADVPSDEKRKKIDALKQDYDYDYLKSEIDYLLKGINEGSTRTAEIVKGLRVFSRLDEDDLKKANINEGLDSTLIIINNQLDNKIEIVKEYGNIPLVECYPGKLNQVFLNIISNALHAVKSKFPGEPGGVLTIGTTNDEQFVRISLKDNGTGMDEKTQKKLFEPFFTTKDVGEGTGLGMSIAYNTIKKHNGNIKVNSELGVGTEFILEIPIVQ